TTELTGTNQGVTVCGGRFMLAGFQESPASFVRYTPSCSVAAQRTDDIAGSIARAVTTMPAGRPAFTAVQLRPRSRERKTPQTPFCAIAAYTLAGATGSIATVNVYPDRPPADVHVSPASVLRYRAYTVHTYIVDGTTGSIAIPRVARSSAGSPVS